MTASTNFNARMNELLHPTTPAQKRESASVLAFAASATIDTALADMKTALKMLHQSKCFSADAARTQEEQRTEGYYSRINSMMNALTKANDELKSYAQQHQPGQTPQEMAQQSARFTRTITGDDEFVRELFKGIL